MTFLLDIGRKIARCSSTCNATISCKFVRLHSTLHEVVVINVR